ncbi:MAG: ATP-dependent Clp protease adaptor ClpS [Spirochaetes bacterium]|nr:ATP-dependent Clp protease adaptor ClpS [Spirochaetota bacterium]MBP8990778.1 ATP-dependent Clp protease adaptor ClpS [Spirochaetota bacterium]
MSQFSESTDIQFDTKDKSKLKEPSMYKVIMHNDDVTTMDFVVFVLQNVFSKNYRESIDLMLTVHKTGSAIVGYYTYDIAISKISKTHELARANGFPLTCTYEKD